MGNVNKRIVELIDRLDNSTDGFGKLIADGTTNRLDIPSIYSYNSERLRLRVDGTRTDPADTTSFTDGQRDFELAPAAGETIQLHSSERPRYVVGYDAAASFSFEGLTPVSTNDTVRIGLSDRDATGNGENSAYFEFTNGQNRCVLERSGTEVDTATFEFPDGYDFQSFFRPEIVYNAYDAGRWLFTLSYTDTSRTIGNRQQNLVVAELGVDNEGATDEYNFNLLFEVDSPDGATELSAGSMAYQIRGDITPALRVKGSRLPNLSYGGSGEYEPVMAIRKDPNRQNIFLEVAQMSLLLAAGSGEAVIIAVDPSDTDASGFDTPPQHSSENSVLEFTESITTFPDSSGTVVTSAPDPGGYQIGHATWESTGQGTNLRTGTESLARKRPLHNGDIGVVLVKRDTASSTTGVVTLNTEQDW